MKRTFLVSLNRGCLCALSALACASVTAFAEDNGAWTSWRGPKDFGSIESGNYPSDLGKDQLRWSAPLPGKGCSTPIHLNGSIYLTAPKEGKDAVVSLDAMGKERWTTVFEQEDAGKHRNGSGCNASPVTDGRSLYVYFKSGTFAALGLDGKVLWQTNLVKSYGKDTLFWDHGTSPVLTAKQIGRAHV